MGIFGDLIINAMGGFPKKPKVPTAPNVNAQQSQLQSTAGNQAALPGLEDLASSTNQFNMGQRQQLLGQAIPGYQARVGEASDVLGNWLSGQISPDVASAVRRNANARSVAGGYGGSGMADNLQARDLGLTSLDLQKMGESALPGFLQTTAGIGVPRQFDPAAGFVSPAEQIGVNQWNETNRYGRDWLQNQLNSIPDPGQAAIAKDVGGIGDVVGTALLTAAGGALGGVAGGMLGGAIGGAGGGGGGMAGGGMDLSSILSRSGGAQPSGLSVNDYRMMQESGQNTGMMGGGWLDNIGDFGSGFGAGFGGLG